MRRQIFVIGMAILMFAIVVCFAQQAGNGNAKPLWWPGEGPGTRNTMSGIVADVSASKIVLQTRQGERTFIVNDATRVMVKGKKATILDVKTGDKAVVKFAVQPDRSLLAKGIIVPKPKITGKITEISGDMFMLTGKEHTWYVTLAGDAKIVSHGYVGTVADLHVGYAAVVTGQVDGDNILAQRVQFRPAVIKGVVKTVNGNIITVRTIRRAEATVTASDATVVLIRPRTAPNRMGTLADIKPGMAINIGGHRTGQHALDALWIDLLVTRQGAGAGAVKQSDIPRQGGARVR